jgi:hypothetical protein
MMGKISFFISLVLYTGIFAPVAATFAADPPASPQAILKAKGLTRSGPIYVLEGEIKLPEELRAMRTAKFKVDQNAAQRASWKETSKPRGK